MNWDLIVSACIENELGFSFSADGPEPWLSYKAIAFFTQRDAATVEKKCGGMTRHSVFSGMVKWSQIPESHTDGISGTPGGVE